MLPLCHNCRTAKLLVIFIYTILLFLSVRSIEKYIRTTVDDTVVTAAETTIQSTLTSWDIFKGEIFRRAPLAAEWQCNNHTALSKFFNDDLLRKDVLNFMPASGSLPVISVVAETEYGSCNLISPLGKPFFLFSDRCVVGVYFFCCILINSITQFTSRS